jgi:hypothetical protein
MTHDTDFAQKATVIVGRCEYILSRDNLEVQHRLIGANTFLGCRDAQHPTPDEKITLQMLLQQNELRSRRD